LIDLIKDKQILVIGLARSGMAAGQLLAEMGAAKITIADQKQAVELGAELTKLERYPAIEAVTGGTPPELVTSDLSVIIKSPGVPPSLEIFKRAEALQIPVLSEVELAYAFIKAPLIGVTGTNGKTTTTALITAMLKESRFEPVVSAGNIGNPLCGIVNSVNSQGVIVAELSSFQLENINSLRPLVAVFLNFAEDHVDYHESIDKYFAAKARIIENQLKSDYVVLNAGDRSVASLAEKSRGRVIWFDRAPVEAGAGLKDNYITIFNQGCEPFKICSRAEVSLPGEHNLENALAASAAAWAAGADPQSIGSVLRGFKAIEHRLEHVATINGVDYINDSKGTNPGASIKALQSFPGRKKILVAGGKDRGSDFDQLANLIGREVRFLLLLGESKDKLARSVEKAGFTNYRQVAGLEEAVVLAKEKALAGDVVLLSPACASWDMFSDYEARGDLFKKIVFELNCGKKAERESGGANNHD